MTCTSALRPGLRRAVAGALLTSTKARCPTATSRARARSASPRTARGDQCDNCGTTRPGAELIEPRSKFVRLEPPELPRDEHLFLDLPAFADQLATGSRRRRTGDRTCATSRSSSSRTSAAADHARPRLGRPDPVRVRGRRTSASRSGSTPLIGYLSARSSGPRPRHARRLARRGGRTPTRATSTSSARTTSSSTRVIWPAHAARLRRGGELGAGRSSSSATYDSSTASS